MTELQAAQTGGESASLWNVSLDSNNWSEFEINLLKAGVMKFGVSNWKEFHKAEVLATKNPW